MADSRPAYDDPELLERVGKAARDADLGGHREAFVRLLPKVRGVVLIAGLLAVGLAVLAAGLLNEFLTRTDHSTSGMSGDVMGLLCVAPFLVLSGYGFVDGLYRGVFGPATYRAIRLDLFERGVVYAADDEVHAVRYATTKMYQELVRHMLYGVVEMRTSHDYTLRDVAGEELRLPDYSHGGPPHAARWGATIRDGVTTAQIPIVAEKLHRGETAFFGPLWLNVREFGSGETSVLWSQVRQIAVEDGRVRVYAEGRWLALSSTPVRKIANFYVFMAMARDLVARNRGPGAGGW